ncbi:preprotein translocase subunit YajC [Pontibacter sp. HSC-14F20]|uniref:Sec translocon accessory complex subunit YajC n=3 Tax=Pontibacter TaxID=323449 RepID=A0A1N6UIQ2_9BACT|nr:MULTISPECIES: preprotein translocase subunit YajC [Pontibacter]EJF10508.1 preprotein translocase subunit YajC [Pontibacter sp. BAB1700]MBF8964482.1 preprotein translocase subunit YajC [Pontibacter sp. FD36]MBX0335113.1 preprotein translocase subunit YajC [Pontibacter sp. HSC-14F20]PVY38204.1 preprotein translocase subunit YajC [Pontibacter virosus]SIQ65422.1 preprotein translocase subunit YajC [Pontibacter lucknowensis]
MQTIFLQAAPDGGMLPQLLMFGAIILVFYFFMIRPQQKKAKDQKKFREELTKGMQVVTIGGLHGRLTAVNDDTVEIEVDKGVRLVFEKSAISLEATAKVK